MRTTRAAAVLCLVFLASALPLSSDQDPAAEAADLMRGAWEGSSPGNGLLLNIRPARPEPQEAAYNLDVTILGKSGKANVNIQGALRFQREGASVRIWWVGERGGCDIPLQPFGDGFQGEAMEGVCATAFQKPVVGKWRLEFDGVNMRIFRPDTGETLRFRKKSEKPTPAVQ
jgi:hypothetical protein